jgi:hypothetical protein
LFNILAFSLLEAFFNQANSVVVTHFICNKYVNHLPVNQPLAKSFVNVACVIQVVALRLVQYNVGVGLYLVKAKTVFQIDENKIQNIAIIDNIFLIMFY